jgi:outer membrane protein with beta-barrel domain
MRRSLSFVVALTILAAPAVHAQGPGSPIAARVTIGPFAGLNYTTLYGSDVDNADSRTDFMLGAQLDVGFGGTGLFRTGLLYSGRGAETTQSGTTGKLKLHYLEIPVLLGYRFGTTGVHPYLNGGANLGIKTGCTIEGSQGGVSISADCDSQAVGADFSTFDFGVVGGGGLQVPVGTSDLTFDLRYTLGLTKIAKDADTKNRGFTLGVGYMIPIGR